MSASVVLVSAVVAAVLLLPPLTRGEVSSSFIPCPDALPAEEGERICYRTVVDAESFTCNATRRSVFPKNVNFRRGQAKIYSPGTRGQEEYRDRQVCNYNTFCPENHFLHYQILTPFFEVESSNDGTCIDFIDLVNLDSVCDPPLSNELICGQLPQSISCRRPGNINLDFNFRSNEGVAMAGFRMDVLCASTENATFSLSRRRRRQVPTSVYTTAVATTTRKLRVPRDAFISYERQVIRVVNRSDGRILGTFRSTRRLFFWTAFAGVQVFRGGAPADADIFGGGVLCFIKSCAYYTNQGIPPEFDPSPSELETLHFLLNATEPFFQSERDLDTDVPDDALPAPSFPLRGRRQSYRYYGQQRIRNRVTPSLTHAAQSRHNATYGPAAARFFTTDDRVSNVALTLAMENANATNIFVRAASLSFLGILEDEDIEILRKKPYR